MTISSTNRVAGPFSGSGTTATFPFSFKVFEAGDLYVVLVDIGSGSQTTLALTTDYSVTLNADQDASPGGTITLTAGDLATGYTLTITTEMAALQGLDLTNGGGFYPDDVNAALDTLTILVQQVLLQLGRAIAAPLGDNAPAMELPSAEQRAGNLLAFDAGGNLLLIPVTGTPAGAVPTPQLCTGAVDGTNRTYTFVAAAGATPVIAVYAGGIRQAPTGDYGAPTYVSGTIWQVVFVTAPTEGPILIDLFA